MASYLASRQAPAKNQAQPVLAQAKPAITTGAAGLCEKFETALKFSSPPNVNFGQEQDPLARFNNNYNQKIRHIEDESVIQKQNASNQMRQAAVMAAVASQQKVRLSATERLAMTAKRPTTNQQIQQLTAAKHEPVGTNTSNNGNNIIAHNSSPMVVANNTKMGPLPTLETLLAVQRQLQQHTKQHLNPVPSQASLGRQNESSIVAERNKALPLPQKSLQQQQATNYVTQQQQPLPPPPPPPPQPTTTSFDTYEKDLPPLPASLSPSTTTDDSQMNSLESHQSSPETSLVSLPPPPPISSYLEQYDEVNSSCHQSIKSTSSSPCTPSTISDISSVRHFPTLQVKSNNLTSVAPTTIANPSVHQVSTKHHLDLPASYARPAENVTIGVQTKATPPKPGPKPPTLPKSQYINLYASPPQPTAPTAQSLTDGRLEHQHSPTASSKITQVTAPPPLPPQPPPPAVVSKQQPAPFQQLISSIPNGQHPPPPPRPAQINYQKHMFNQVQQQTQQMPSLAFMPQPPPPLSMAASGGFDEPDSGSFRFPTPPPPDLLLDSTEDEDEVGEEEVVGDENDEDVDDDEFQCKIPTPPPQQHSGASNKSMSAASFQASDLLCSGTQQQRQLHQYNNNAQHSPSPIFSSSTYSAGAAQTVKDVQTQPPPPLFRHQAPNPTPSAPPPAPPAQQSPNQLTVHINNETTGLLSTTNLRQDRHHHHHHHHHHFAISNSSNSNNHCNSNGHHIMLAMTASSSSPSSSSSSDNDGHSSNSSSSTSGIHSSIDSPSSSNDFNYGVAKTKTKLDLKNTANNNHLEAHLLRKNNSGGDLGGSRSGNNQRPPITTTVTTTARRPALKQKKTVSFSDKVELVACADEQHDDHLPNPLLARVLAGKMQ